MTRPPALTDVLLDTLRARVCASTSDTYTTTEVFTGGELAVLPSSTVTDVHTAYERAARARQEWSARPLDERLAVFHRFHSLLLKERETVVDLLQAETGKSRRDAFEELCEPALVTSYYLRTAPKLLRPKKRAGLMPGAIGVVELRQPKGVVGIISPWNYPFALAFGDLIPALIAGNGVVLKPDSQTALSPLFGTDLLYRSGLPEGLLQVVLGDGPTIGGAVVDTCDYIGFTGSSRTGALIAARAGERLIGCSLELGGKNPMIVLPDVNIEAAARSAVRGCFANVAACAEDGVGARGRRAGEGRDGADRWSAAPGPRAVLLRADGADGRHAGHAVPPRGDVRAGGVALRVHDGGRGGVAGERHGLRPERECVRP
jgi:succinate-semialdehyde dehydrogenase/glutarate-semialdehyde dehydrogenase